MNKIALLPDEIILDIISYLDPINLLNFRNTNREYEKLCEIFFVKKYLEEEKDDREIIVWYSTDIYQHFYYDTFKFIELNNSILKFKNILNCDYNKIVDKYKYIYQNDIMYLYISQILFDICSNDNFIKYIKIISNRQLELPVYYKDSNYYCNNNTDCYCNNNTDCYCNNNTDCYCNSELLDYKKNFCFNDFKITFKYIDIKYDYIIPYVDEIYIPLYIL